MKTSYTGLMKSMRGKRLSKGVVKKATGYFAGKPSLKQELAKKILAKNLKNKISTDEKVSTRAKKEQLRKALDKVGITSEERKRLAKIVIKEKVGPSDDQKRKNIVASRSYERMRQIRGGDSMATRLGNEKNIGGKEGKVARAMEAIKISKESTDCLNTEGRNEGQSTRNKISVGALIESSGIADDYPADNVVRGQFGLQRGGVGNGQVNQPQVRSVAGGTSGKNSNVIHADFGNKGNLGKGTPPSSFGSVLPKTGTDG